MDWVERAGVSLRYEHRAGEGPTLVLVHEMGGSLESWDDIFPLMSRGLPTLRFDGRGSGLSSKLRGKVLIQDLSADIDTALEAAGVNGPVILIGVAVGAAVALHYAAHRPDRVLGLLPFGPATGMGPERRTATQARADLVETSGMGAIADAALSQSYPHHLRDNTGRFDRLRARWLGNDPGSYAAVLRMVADLHMEAELAAIRCPTVVLAGRSDLVRPPDSVRVVADQVPRARFRTIDSGHFASVQAPDVFAEALDAFLHEIGT
jgi:pimeloyl-ACP methyl ester carboxylesterase